MDLITDVLIAGVGVAGLYSALNIRRDLNIILITKSKIGESNTYLAQGGIAVARNKEDIPLYIEDTLRAGKYENDIEAVKILTEESRDNINELIKLGVRFNRENNELIYTREGAHSINRIVHHNDETGKEVAETLYRKVAKLPNVKIYEEAYLTDIIKEDNLCKGGIIIKDNKQINIRSKVTILATGGLGGLFINSTNWPALTADGVAIALRNNIKTKNLQYIQFHPTGLYDDNPKDRRFLISEAVRGEGGKLLNINGERFVNELLPRDVVSDAIYKEMEKTKSKFVYLDVTFLPQDFLKKRFPKIYDECKKRGIDITKDYIPVAPTQHYFMGGIEVDLHSRTSMKNLYACGEVSCTGVHGANRLASNSLLEALVYSRRTAQVINKEVDNIKISTKEINELTHDKNYYENLNKKIIIDKIKRLGGKFTNELVNS